MITSEKEFYSFLEKTKKAYYWHKKASDNGNFDSKVRLADFTSEGIGCEKDIETAFKLYQ